MNDITRELADALRGAVQNWTVPSSICKDRPAYEAACAALDRYGAQYSAQEDAAPEWPTDEQIQELWSAHEKKAFDGSMRLISPVVFARAVLAADHALHYPGMGHTAGSRAVQARYEGLDATDLIERMAAKMKADADAERARKAMSDITYRLRLHADNKTKSAMQCDGMQAADEIERLRGERNVLADLLSQARDPLETMLYDGENDQASYDMLLTLSCDINAALSVIDAEELAQAKPRSTSMGEKA